MSKLVAKRVLPSKEASLFREVLSHYETRQLKKGLKAADQILKKHPEHGETLAMKGLIVANMGRREEGLELAKKGVRYDLTSHIVWHVFGLCQKLEKNYDEALKSYTQALRFDRDNMNILRDAASLQCQLRLFDGLVDTRHTILRLRPNLRQNWVSLAVAYYLNGSPEEALRVLENYEGTLKNVPPYDVENSETALFHVTLLDALGQYQEALSFLDTNSKSRVIVDKTAVMEKRAHLLSKIQSADAEQAWRTLIDHNPDCTTYYHGYVSGKSTEDTLASLREFAAHIPRANAPKRLSLDYASGDTFKDLASAYITAGITKGVPSLFADVKSLYKDPAKLEIIQALLDALPADDPSTHLWLQYFRAQHYSHLGQYDRALEILESSITHTPTLPELYTCRARTYKRAGDPYKAARSLEEARLLDGQDRFLNTKSAKYYLRAGLVEEAYLRLGMFTKKDAPSPQADLEDMQSLLYLIEDADAHAKLGKVNVALKKYVAIQKVFDEIEDDQYDFHGYSMRKFTVTAYLDLLSWADTLRSHPTFVKAAIAASKIFVSVFDDPSIIAQLSQPAKSSSAEKKAQKKAKKAAQKQAEDAKKAAAKTDVEPEPVAPKDEDVDGLKLLGCSDPLEQAAKFLQPLVDLEIKNIDLWITVYDVAIRRGKKLQAVRALSRAHALDAEHPELHVRLVHLRKTVTEPVGDVFDEAADKLLPKDLSLETFNSQYLQKHASAPLGVLAAARVLHVLGLEFEETVFATLAPDVRLDVRTALEVVTFLGKAKSVRTEEYKGKCDERFELATVFKTQEEQDRLRKEAVNIQIASLPDEVEV